MRSTFNFVIILYVLFSVGCATNSSKSHANQYIELSVTEKKIIFKPRSLDLEQIRFHVFRIENKKSGKFMVDNRHEYLSQMIKQDFGTYYNQPKFTEECLKKNRLEKIELAPNYGFSGHLTVDSNWNVGICDEHAIESRLLVGFCENENIFFEVYAQGKNLNDLEIECGIPLKLTKR